MPYTGPPGFVRPRSVLDPGSSPARNGHPASGGPRMRKKSSSCRAKPIAPRPFPHSPSQPVPHAHTLLPHTHTLHPHAPTLSTPTLTLASTPVHR